MHPIKLTISAFGSYAKKQEIVFDRNKENLFLITGNTGAGKTTIFDAICFALYGEMSGEHRQGKMMRSDFALPDQKTYVEFIFKDKETLYKVTRSPEYYRKSKRKKKKENGSLEYCFVKEAAKAELFLLNGEKETCFLGNIREINAKLIEILGLDQGQFTKIAMLAQGEFMKLLMSPTDQKKEIFQKLFHTEKYGQITKLIGERKKEKESLFIKSKIECELILQETECDENSDHLEKFNTYKASYFLHQKEFLQILNSLIKEETLFISQKKKELQSLKKENDQFLLKIYEIEETNRLFHVLAQAKEKMEYWQKKEKEKRKKETKLENANRAEHVMETKTILDEIERKRKEKEKNIEKKEKEKKQTKMESERTTAHFILAEKEKKEKEALLQKEISKIEQNLQKYDEIETIQKKRKKQEDRQSILYKTIAHLDKEIQTLEKNIFKWEQQQLEMEQELQKLPEKKIIFLQTRETLIAYQDLKKEIEKIPDLLYKKEESQKLLTKTEKEFKEKSRLYEDMMIRFTNGQAGLMAEQLRHMHDMPCPVCGNTHYKLLAPLETNVPTQEQIKKTKKERDYLEQEMQKIAEIVNLNKHTYDMQSILCQEKYKQLTNSDEFYLSSEKETKIEKTIAALEKKKQELELEKNILERMEQKQKNHKEKIRNAKKEMIQKGKRKEEIKEEKGTIDQELSRLWAIEEIQKKELPYHNKQEAISHLEKKKEALKLILITYQELQNQLDNLNYRLLQQETEIKTMQKDLKDLYAEEKEKRESYKKIQQEEGFLLEKEWLLAIVEKEEKQLLQQEIEQIKKETIIAKQSVIELEKQLKGKEIQDSKIQKQLLEEKKQSIDLLSRKVQSIEFRQKKNKDALKKLKEKERIYQILEQEYQEIKTLYHIANGTLPGAIKIDLETFVLRQYLKQVLNAANRRFLMMSKGQFELRLKEGKNFDQRSNQGLDFSVYSLLTNTSRDIKTLSGGETFMAALSMALGMADIIQNMSGALHFDMMFIDEGFGSLDELSRQQAIQVLQELSYGKRMIGVISHVAELKEQILQKLIVKKTEHGSIAYWE